MYLVLYNFKIEIGGNSFMRKIIIIGGEFNNKGAQAMSFIAISRIKEEYPDHEILFVSSFDAKKTKEELSNYNFQIIQSPFMRNNLVGENLLRKLLNKDDRPNPKSSKKYLEQTDYLFDISGYALSSQWGRKSSLNFLKRFNVSNKHNIKTIILPQSIGPFDYPTEDVSKKIKNTLQTVQLIMPREISGVEVLRKLDITKNVSQIADLVLTNKKEISWENIYKEVPKNLKFNIGNNGVAIIPNMRNFEHGNKEDILSLYVQAINHLKSLEKRIFLIRHSGEDLKACKQIKEYFPNDDSVLVIEDDLKPTEFESLIKQFDFAIASRFHSVVHAYKMGVPCIILGWAIKYVELAKLFKQEKFVFDVRNSFDTSNFFNSIDIVNKNQKQLGEDIRNGLEKLEQTDDPFELAFKILKK